MCWLDIKRRAYSFGLKTRIRPNVFIDSSIWLIKIPREIWNCNQLHDIFKECKRIPNPSATKVASHSSPIPSPRHKSWVPLCNFHSLISFPLTYYHPCFGACWQVNWLLRVLYVEFGSSAEAVWSGSKYWWSGLLTSTRKKTTNWTQIATTLCNALATLRSSCANREGIPCHLLDCHVLLHVSTVYRVSTSYPVAPGYVSRWISVVDWV